MTAQAPKKRTPGRAKALADDLADALLEVIADARGKPSGVIHFDVPADAPPGAAWAAVQEAKSKKIAATARHKVGTDARDLAVLLGVSVATVKAWEAGTKVPTGANKLLLEAMVAQPRYWKKRLRLALAEAAE